MERGHDAGTKEGNKKARRVKKKRNCFGPVQLLFCDFLFQEMSWSPILLSTTFAGIALYDLMIMMMTLADC